MGRLWLSMSGDQIKFDKISLKTDGRYDAAICQTPALGVGLAWIALESCKVDQYELLIEGKNLKVVFAREHKVDEALRLQINHLEG